MTATRLLLVVAALGVTGCSDTPLEAPDAADLYGLIVSEAHPVAVAEDRVGAASTGLVAYVSLPTGTLSDLVSVRVRNLTAGGAAAQDVTVVDGGFDPVIVAAAPGDRLELQLTRREGAVTVMEAIVPIRKPPVVVRMAPPGGRTDVALSVRPAVVFSEPVDPVTLPVGMRLLRGDVVVSGRIELPEPWRAEFVPDVPLAPSTTYRLVLTQEVQDLEGTPLEAPAAVDFTTAAGPPPAAVPLNQMRIAFVSSREGPSQIYLANGDGSDVSRLTTGFSPAWSWDDRRIAFHRDTPGGPVIGVINVDGSGERVLGPGMYPAWSPDGRIAFVSSGSEGGIAVMNADGTGYTKLLGHDFAYQGCVPAFSVYAWWGDCVTYPQWSLDGRRIVFFAGDAGYSGSQVYVMNADGSSPLPLVLPQNQSQGGWNGRMPTWAPDGSLVAFEWGGPGSVISAIDPDGVGTLTTLAGGRDPSWSPDGHWIAYGAEGQSRIVATNVVTGEFHGQLVPEAEAPARRDYWDSSVEWAHTIR
jgi:dipeptidyl aminopeptidase/acylaminoacyl peptidase